MASTSGRRSGSSGSSERRRKVHVGTGAASRDAVLNPRVDVEPDAREKRQERAEQPRRAKPKRTSRPARGREHDARAGAEAARLKREERQRRLAQQSRRRTQRIALVSVILLVVIAGGVALYRSSLFEIRVVDVVGVERLTADGVRVAAAVPEGSTLLRFPRRAIEATLVADPWIESVQITRDFPHTLRIRVAERQPAALLDTGDAFWVIDAAGVVLGEQSIENTATLVVIRDVPGLDPKPGRAISSEPLGNALDVLAGISAELRGKVRAVSAPSIDETTLLTTDTVEILVGEALDLSRKDAIVTEIMREQAGKVVFIDVRNVERPVSRGLAE